MNVIIAYLETMFGAYPQTPRLLEAKAELHSMMEDAYTSLIAAGRSENEAVGQVISDFGNLEEVAPVLGITSDITPGETAAVSQHPVVALEEAKAYAAAQEGIRFRVTSAVVLFVLSPVLLLLLPVAAESGTLQMADAVAQFIGLLTVLVLVGSGVLLLVNTSRETSPYKHIAEGRFVTSPDVVRWADALADQHEHARIRALQIAIGLWILAAAPMIAFGLLLEDSPHSDLWSALGVVLVLVMVAAGLAILLPKTWAHTVAEMLRQGTKAGSGKVDDKDGIIAVIAAIYWPLLTAIYLAWSFIGDAWAVSWIIWPVGGVLFGAIAAGSGAIENYRNSRR